jgi:hypothetical protein
VRQGHLYYVLCFNGYVLCTMYYVLCTIRTGKGKGGEANTRQVMAGAGDR